MCISLGHSAKPQSLWHLTICFIVLMDVFLLKTLPGHILGKPTYFVQPESDTLIMEFGGAFSVS